MYQPIALYIGLRYMRGKISDHFSCFVSWLPTIGIMLGIMALVTILSVMNGFEHKLENNILGLMPQVLLTTPKGQLNPKHIPIKVLNTLKGMAYAAPLTTSDLILQSAKNITMGVMLGINPTDPEPLSQYLINTSIDQLEPRKYRVILGNRLATKLGVQRGDQLRLIVPSASQITPIGHLPIQRIFTVAGIYAANSEVDGYQLLVNQQDASCLMHYPVGYITGWRIWLNQPLMVDSISRQYLPNGLVWKDWRERKGELFQAIRIEKNMMGLLLSLIVVVATCNIITSIGLLSAEKHGEVAILQTYGMTRLQITLVFITQGASTAIIGTLLGIVLGILLTSQLNYLILVIGISLNDTTLPVYIDPQQITTIALLAIAISILSTIYPSWRIAAVHPVEALRYE